MSLLPDAGEIVALANRLADHADAVRAAAERLRGATLGAGWHGRAARSFETAAAEVIDAMRRSGGRLDGAADSLRAHAHRVQDAMDVLSGIEHGLLHLGGDVVSALRHAGHAIGIG